MQRYTIFFTRHSKSQKLAIPPYVLMRMTSADVTGLVEIRIRIARDRKLVVDVGGLTVAMGDIHQETFEEATNSGVKEPPVSISCPS